MTHRSSKADAEMLELNSLRMFFEAMDDLEPFGHQPGTKEIYNVDKYLVIKAKRSYKTNSRTLNGTISKANTHCQFDHVKLVLIFCYFVL